MMLIKRKRYERLESELAQAYQDINDLIKNVDDQNSSISSLISRLDLSEIQRKQAYEGRSQLQRACRIYFEVLSKVEGSVPSEFSESYLKDIRNANTLSGLRHGGY